jgi:hypothetical protein
MLSRILQGAEFFLRILLIGRRLDFTNTVVYKRADRGEVETPRGIAFHGI